MVVRVINQYHVCRAQADGDRFAHIKVLERLDDAVALACRVAAYPNRVLLFPQSGTPDFVEVDCAQPAAGAK
ncbi:MAG: hypothetical protein ABI868_23950 [Acidobacteriota bacterium]